MANKMAEFPGKLGNFSPRTRHRFARPRGGPEIFKTQGWGYSENFRSQGDFGFTPSPLPTPDNEETLWRKVWVYVNPKAIVNNEIIICNL